MHTPIHLGPSHDSSRCVPNRGELRPKLRPGKITGHGHHDVAARRARPAEPFHERSLAMRAGGHLRCST
jgi:hypothetical protein